MARDVPIAASDRRWANSALVLGLSVYIVVLGYLVAEGSRGHLLLAIGAPLWFYVAYRYPLVGVAVLSAGQFLLRTLVGTVSVLSRGVGGGSTVLTGAILLLPLVAAVLTKGDLARIPKVFREDRMVLWPLAAISVAVVLSYYLAPSSYGQLKLIAYVGLNLPLFVFPLVLIRDERDAKVLLIATVVVSTVTLASSVLGSASVWHQTALRGTIATNGQLADQPVDVGTWFARRVGIGGLAAVSILLMTRQRRAYIYWGAAAALFSGVVLAATRGPVLGSILALTLMLTLPGRAIRRKGARAAIVMVGVVAALVAITYLPPQFADRYRTAFSANDPSIQARLTQIPLSEQLIRQAPLTGVGLGHYPIALWGVDRIIYPHSLILEFAAELGIPVALLLLLMVWGTLRKGYVAVRKSTRPWIQGLGLWAIGMQVLSFTDGQLSGDLRTNEHVWFAAGIAVAAAYLARHEAARPPGYAAEPAARS